MIISINLKCSKQEHLIYLEEIYGDNVYCECDQRTKLLIDYGVYCIEKPNNCNVCVYSCRVCQYDRMMKNPEYSFRM